MSYFRDITKTEAFAQYGAKLNNPINEYSAIATDGSVILECWTHLIDDKRPDGKWRYQIDDFAHWTNSHGKRLLMSHLLYAFEHNKKIRLVLATPKKGAKPAVAGLDGTKIPKIISIREKWIGRVVSIDDEHFIVDFQKI